VVDVVDVTGMVRKLVLAGMLVVTPDADVPPLGAPQAANPSRAEAPSTSSATTRFRDRASIVGQG
jgi:hypothetical protein